MKIEPENRDLWNRFQSCERNEMIITKSGRCLFPVLKFNIIFEDSDLPAPSPDSTFSYGLAMERVDSYKWKYRDGHWFPLAPNPSNSLSSLEPKWHVYEPETSPSTWLQVFQEGLNFSKAKLTNRKASTSILHVSNASMSTSGSSSCSNYFSLSSFGHYVPVVYLLNWDCFIQHHKDICIPSSIEAILESYNIKELEREGCLKIIHVYECSFIAVTHYQNVLITYLKKHNNPHAKGFVLTDESIGRMPHNVPRGKPGRKSRIHETTLSPESHDPHGQLSYDVYLASKALESMSTLNIPRSEIIKTSAHENIPVDEESSKKEKGHKFVNYYNKLK